MRPPSPKAACGLARLNSILLTTALLVLSPPPPVSPPAASAQDDFKDELPRIPPVEPNKALDTFEIAPGFEVQLVAHEPLVTDPVAIAFDARGRVFVVEMRGYSEDPNDNLGRVRLLEDTDGDGRLDKGTTYVDKLSWPTAVACWDGGVFIGVAPDILYCKDTDGDGVADIRKRVFTGFGRGNVQGLFNSFRWGLDNRIHGATSSAGASVTRVGDKDSKPVVLRGRDFAFDPRTLELEPTSGGGQHGMCFDDFGRKFVSANSDHLQMIVLDDHLLKRNPYVKPPPVRLSIAADGGQAPVFRISPVEPWRIVRTRLRVAGEVRGPIEGGGKAAGYFTGATGVTIYRGDAWPSEHRGTAFIGDVGSNVVHRKRLEPKGYAFVGKRIDEGREFLASRDIWFRPVQFANAPDGCLWVIDMYREVIEHPKSLPPAIKKHLDLTSGRNRGRLYRIAPKGYKPRATPNMTGMTLNELVDLLGHSNAWHRETATRLIVERGYRQAVPVLLTALRVGEKPNTLLTLHVFAALDGLDALAPQPINWSMEGVDESLHEWLFWRLARGGLPSGVARRESLDLAATSKHRLRLAAAHALGQLNPALQNDPEQIRVLAVLLHRHGDDAWLAHAALSGVNGLGGHMLFALIDRALRDGQSFNRSACEQVAYIAGRQSIPTQTHHVVEAITQIGKRDKAAAAATRAALERGIAAANKAARAQTLAAQPMPVTAAKRAELDALIAKYQPALKLKGNAATGRMLFAKHCAQCHKADGVGHELAPSLAAAAQRGPEFLMVNILDPNREVNPLYKQWVIDTADGDQLAGMITTETAASVTLTQAEAKQRTILRADIAAIRDPKLSLMPEGLHKGIDVNAMADLLAYLRTVK